MISIIGMGFVGGAMYKSFNEKKIDILFEAIGSSDGMSKKIVENAIKNKIKTAEISFIGAVQNLNVVYFNQITKEYEEHSFDGGFEVLSGLGNITLFENKPLVHIHISVSDKDGKAFGGHLVNGTKIWLIEAIIKQPTFIGKNYINRIDSKRNKYKKGETNYARH